MRVPLTCSKSACTGLEARCARHEAARQLKPSTSKHASIRNHGLTLNDEMESTSYPWQLIAYV